MNTSRLAITLILTTSQTTSAFFSPFTVSQHRSCTNLHSSIAEDTYPSFLSSASACANSDSCSLEMAEGYLREIVRIESACVAGTMSGEAVCGDVLRVSEVVAGLRKKIKEGAERGARTFWQQRQDEFESLVTASIGPQSSTLSPVATLTQAPIKPAYLAIAALYTIAVISIFQSNTNTISDVVPFTAQEIWWAIRDGYILDLTQAYFKHGGLLVSDNSLALSPLTPQEMWWAIRDGYANNLMADWLRNGGLMGTSNEFVAMTPQEMWWAIRDGYVSNVL